MTLISSELESSSRRCRSLVRREAVDAARSFRRRCN